ncbi:DNA-directed DNA polymerase [Alphaproteobacteria bacterium]|nr:DNA-directed DNA polymerase [Alphaproteobacteria bacterium]
MQPRFVHLRVHSSYSLLYSTVRIAELAKAAAADHMPAVAVCDKDNLFGAFEFSQELAKAGIQPILGVSLTIAHAQASAPLTLLAQNQRGWANLISLVSRHWVDGGVAPADLAAAQEGIICLTGGSQGLLGALLAAGQGEVAEALLLSLRESFGDRLYIEISRHNRPADAGAEPVFLDWAERHGIALVAASETLFLNEDMREAHAALVCIGDKTIIDDENARRFDASHRFLTQEEMGEKFADLPEALASTVHIARRCSWLLEPMAPALPHFADDEDAMMEAKAKEGLEWRFDAHRIQEAERETYRQRLAYEIDTIQKMGFAGYFLIVSDFIGWGKAQGIPIGPARGSGGGSLVAWALKITDINPMPFGLMFERFLNPERISMPDFDIDFCQERRAEVIGYVQSKYGADKVGQIITYGSLQAKAAIRDCGRVLGMPYSQCDSLSKLIVVNPNKKTTFAEVMASEPEFAVRAADDEQVARLLDIVGKIEGLYRNTGVHAAGVVIGAKPLAQIVPLYKDPAADWPVSQFDMHWVEQSSLIKFDFLGLKTLTIIDKTVKFIEAGGGGHLDILNIPMDDKETFVMLARAETSAVFQFESSGMRDIFLKMRPDRFEDLIALVALYRPGPMANIPSYIERKAGREAISYPHELAEPFLKETYGIIVYQEQIMLLAQVVAGYSLGGADILRRAMGKKKPDEMAKQREKFVAGCLEKKTLDAKGANDLFDVITPFAGYGFNKSHAAAYALISYQTAYLKAHHPVEFMAANMNIELRDTDKLADLVREAKRLGLAILPCDINESGPEFAPRKDAIRYGLAAVKGVGLEAMRDLARLRAEKGPFKSLEDFLSRIDPRMVNRKAMESLILAGAFDCLHPNRAELWANLDGIMAFAQAKAEDASRRQMSLFGAGQVGGGLTIAKTKPWTLMEQLARELEAVGFYLSAHPLESYRGAIVRLGAVSYAEVDLSLSRKTGAARFSMAVLITGVKTRISKKGSRYAFVSCADMGAGFEITCFSETLARCGDMLASGKPLLIGVVAEKPDAASPPRFTLQSAEYLDHAAAGATEKLLVRVDSASALPEIKALLDTQGKGRHQVVLTVPSPSAKGTAEIVLPARYAFGADFLETLRGIAGVGGIEQA